jgi:vacuolar-type H+-ATPase subunit E/Vma4
MDLLKKIEEEGESEAARILAEAEQEVQRRLAEAEQRIQAWKKEYTERAHQEIESEKRLVLSRARVKARELLLRAKSRAAEGLFDQLVQEAASLRANAARYQSFLRERLREAEKEISGGLVVHGDPADGAIFQELLRGSPHQLGEPIQTLGGFLATNRKGDLVIDNRLETRIANLRQSHRPQLSQALFDRSAPPDT